MITEVSASRTPAMGNLAARFARAGWLPLILGICLTTFYAGLQTFLISSKIGHHSALVQLGIVGAVFVVLFLVSLALLLTFFSVVPRWLSYPLPFVAAIALTLWAFAASTTVKTATASTPQGPVPVEAVEVKAWRATLWAFSLHPQYDDQHPVEEITVPVPLGGMTTMILRLSKPRTSVLGIDGAYLGDGVQVYVTKGRSGPRRQHARAHHGHSRGCRQAWLALDRHPPAPGDREVTVKITKGPAGSNAGFDYTFVSLAFWGPRPSLSLMGDTTFTLMLGALLLIVVSVAAPALARTWPMNRLEDPQLTALDGVTIAVIAVMALLLALLLYNGLHVFVWRHDSFYYLLQGDYLGKFTQEGRWLNLALFPVLKAIPGNIAWLVGLACFGYFTFVCALGVSHDRIYSSLVALLCMQSVPLYLMGTWPEATLAAYALLALAALVYTRMPILLFYVVFGILFMGTVSQFYYLLPLLHLSRFAEEKRFRWQPLIGLLIFWAAGFVAGFAVIFLLEYIITGHAGLEIGAWRHPHYINSAADLAANIQSRAAFLWDHWKGVYQGPLVAACLMLAVAVRVQRRSLPFMFSALLLSTAIVLAHYAITIPIGISIEWRTAIATFVGVLAFVFVSQRVDAARRAVLALCALGVFLQYWVINTGNVSWFRTVTSTYYDELVRASPLPPAHYKGLIVEGLGARELEESIIDAHELLPRYGEPLSVLTYDEMGGDWRWGAAAWEAGFRQVFFCPREPAGFCAQLLKGFKGDTCELQKGVYCVLGVTEEDYLVIRFNTDVMTGGM